MSLNLDQNALASLDKVTREKLLATVYGQLWARGELDFLRHAKQLEFKRKFRESKGRKFYLNNSRRWGKSHELILTALELCLTKKNARVLYLCAQGSDAEAIAGDLVQRILTGVDEDGTVNEFKACPRELMPEYSAQKREYHFPSTGAVWRLKGTNGEHAKYLRGTAQDLIILDEAANMDDLQFIISSILLPMLLTTGGRLLAATTPARTPSHYSTQLYEECARTGNAVMFTIRDAPHIPEAVKLEFLIEAGEKREEVAEVLAGTKPARSTTTRREYFCEFVSDSGLAIFPEFDAAARLEVVKEWPVPPFRDLYVSMDPGSRDNTGVLFFYWDYLNAKIVVEDELLFNNPSTAQIAEAISKKEIELWGNDAKPTRITDVDLRMIQDMATTYGLQFRQVRGKDVLADVNFMRHLITTRMLVISPKCTGFVRQLSNVIWNNSGNDFWRDKEGIDRHFDLVAAAKYGFRSINMTKSPPEEFFIKSSPLGGLKRKPPGRKFTLRGNTPIDNKLKKR